MWHDFAKEAGHCSISQQTIMRSTTDFLLGIAVGVGVGMLVAPKSGKETREELLDALEKQTGDLKQQLNQGIDMAKDKYGELKGQAQSKLDSMKQPSQTDQLKGAYNDKVDDLADGAKYGINETESALKTY
jgi:gas vesicle protein